MGGLRRTAGHLTPDFAQALQSRPYLMRDVVRTLLDEHFYESNHEQILATTGITLPQAETRAEPADVYGKKRLRDSRFRERVLRAYEHRCAVTGFRAALARQYLGCEAAHVKMHSYGGPDSVQNGFAVEPTLHTLFDIGAWTLTDDRRILVSSHLSGDHGTVERLRGLHGRKLARPLAGEPEIAVEYIRWQRDASLGGVFRHPALPL